MEGLVERLAISVAVEVLKVNNGSSNFKSTDVSHDIILFFKDSEMRRRFHVGILIINQ